MRGLYTKNDEVQTGKTGYKRTRKRAAGMWFLDCKLRSRNKSLTGRGKINTFIDFVCNTKGKKSILFN